MRKLRSPFFPVYILVFAILASVNVSAQVAPVSPPTGGFAIDGNLKANTPTSPAPFAPNQGDWIFGPGGTGDSVISYLGIPFNTSTTGLSRDKYNNNTDNIFTSGSKFNDYVSALKWSTNSATSKDDINTGLYHVSSDPSTQHQWIMIGGDRYSVNGTSFIDFELLQSTITIVGTTGGTFVGGGPDGGRTEGDIDISMEYTNGGTKPKVVIYRWKQDLSGTWAWDSTGSHLITDAFGETNRAGSVDVPFGAFGSQTYQQFAFVEGAVDVTELLSSGGNCEGITIHTIWIKTKASNVATAALKDFMQPISVDIQFGDASVTHVSPLCANADPVCLSGSPAGGTFTGTGVVADQNCTSGFKFSPSGLSAGDHVITYEVTLGIGCTKQVKDTITVYALPTASISGTTAVCKNATSPNITFTGSGGTKPYTFTYDINGGQSQTVSTTGTNTSVTVAAPTGTPGTFIYNLTGVSDGHCSNTASGSATITVNNLPTVSADDNSVCTGSSVQMSGSPTGGTWSGAHINSSGLFNAAGLSAGTYDVTYTYTDGNGCTNSDNATVTVNGFVAQPVVTYNAPKCDEDTFSLTISNVVAGADYYLADKNGDPMPAGVSPASPYHAPNSSNFTFRFIPAGSGYQVSVTSTNGCSENSPESCGEPSATTKASTFSENVQSQTATVKAYPNPFSDRIKFVITTPVSGKGNLEVYNMMGQRVKTVYQGFISAGTQTFEMSLPNQQIANLVYVLRIGDKKVSGKILQINQ